MEKRIIEQELLKMELTTGGTLEDYLKTLPERGRSITIEAAYECLKRKWPLHEANLQGARQIIWYGEKSGKGNRKG